MVTWEELLIDDRTSDVSVALCRNALQYCTSLPITYDGKAAFSLEFLLLPPAGADVAMGSSVLNAADDANSTSSA